MEPLMDATPFPADAETFYSRRDHRTNAYGQFDVRYADRSVLITADPRALTSFAGQVMFLITCNRLCGAPHNRFNAANMIMRTLILESPNFCLS